jgi:hypothetical protein
VKPNWTTVLAVGVVFLGGGMLQAQEQEEPGKCVWDVSIGGLECSHITNWIEVCDDNVQEECGDDWTVQTATCSGGQIHCSAIRAN